MPNQFNNVTSFKFVRLVAKTFVLISLTTHNFLSMNNGPKVLKQVSSFFLNTVIYMVQEWQRRIISVVVKNSLWLLVVTKNKRNERKSRVIVVNHEKLIITR